MRAHIFGLVNFGGLQLEATDLRPLCGNSEIPYATWIEGSAGLGRSFPFRLTPDYPDASDSSAVCLAPDRSQVVAAEGDLDLSFPAVLECEEKLCGQWSRAIWEPGPRVLRLSRDLAGCTNLFYCRMGDWMAFSSSLTALLSHPWVPKDLDERAMARCLLPALGGEQETSYRYIRRVPGGCWLRADQHGIQRQAYQRLESLKSEPPADAVAEMRRHFFAAVQRTLGNARPLLTLSSGLDSGAVASVAASLKPGLQALVWRPSFTIANRPGYLPDEWDLAQATGRHAGDLQLHQVLGRGSFLQSVRELQSRTGSPLLGTGNAPWLLDSCQICSELGIPTMLVASGGNVSSAYSGRATGVRRWLSDLRSKLRRPQSSGPTLARASWLASMAADEPVSERQARSMILRYQGSAWAQLGASFGIEFRDPTADTELARFCFSLPEAAYMPVALASQAVS